VEIVINNLPVLDFTRDEVLKIIRGIDLLPLHDCGGESFLKTSRNPEFFHVVKYDSKTYRIWHAAPGVSSRKELGRENDPKLLRVVLSNTAFSILDEAAELAEK
jgi:hypothetical protein